MSETPAPWPLVPGSMVTARFAQVYGDSSDEDYNTEWVVPVGMELTFAPTITGPIIYDPTGAKIIAELKPFQGVVNPDGYVVAKDGGQPIRLLPTNDPLMSRTGWLWTCSWAGGKVSFPVPSAGEVNIADFIVAPPGNPAIEEWVDRIANSIEAAGSLVSIDTVTKDAGDIVVTLTDGSVTRLPIPGDVYVVAEDVSRISMNTPERLMAALEARAPSVAIAIAGDSTADALNEWPHELAKNIAAAYPHLTVTLKNWNPGTLAYYGDITVQTGTGPTISWNRTRRDQFHRTVADIIGTNTEEGGVAWVDGGGGNAAGNWSADGTSAVAGAHTTRAPILVSTGQQGSSRTRWVYEFGALTGARQVDHYIRRAGDANRLFVTTARNADGTVYVSLSKRVASTTVSLQNLGNIPMPVDKTFTVEASVTVNGDGTATVAVTVNGTPLNGTLSASDWAAVNSGYQQGLYVVNGTPTGDRWHLFELSLPEEVFPQQTLTVYNGSAPGTTLDYQTTHLATMYPSGVDIDQLWVASSHNETTMPPAAYLEKVSAFIDAVRAIHPSIAPVLSSQNPEFRPNMSLARAAAHRLRCSALKAYAAQMGYGYAPIIETWEKEPDGGVDLVSSDGLHPETGAGSGSEFWGRVAYDYLAGYAMATTDEGVASFVADTTSATRIALGNIGRRFAIFGDSWTTPLDGVSIPNNAVAAVGGTVVANHGVAGAIIGPSSQNGGNATDAQAAAAAADTSYNKSLITDVLVIAGVNNIGSYLPNVAEIRDHFAAIGSLYPRARLWYVGNSKRTLTYDSDPWRWYHRFFEGAALAGFAVAQLSPLWNLGTLRGQPSVTLATDYWSWTNPSGLGSRHMAAAGQTAWAKRLAGFLSGNPWHPECKVPMSLHSNASALVSAAGVSGTPTINTDDTYLDGNVLRLNVSVAGMENLAAVPTSAFQPVLQIPEGYWPAGNYIRRVGMLSRLSGGTMTPYVIEVTQAGVVQVDGRGLNDHVGFFLINAEVPLNTPKLA